MAFRDNTAYIATGRITGRHTNVRTETIVRNGPPGYVRYKVRKYGMEWGKRLQGISMELYLGYSGVYQWGENYLASNSKDEFMIWDNSNNNNNNNNNNSNNNFTYQKRDLVVQHMESEIQLVNKHDMGETWRDCFSHKRAVETINRNSRYKKSKGPVYIPL